MDDGTTHVSAFFTPSDVGRRGRWSRRSAARRRSSEARGSVAAVRRESLQAERDAAAQTAYLPAGGEAGADALRSIRRLRLPSHRATSEVLAGAYPFLAEAGLGSDGVFIGQDAWSGGGFSFDPWVLYAQGVITNPNCMLAGVLGKGKSCLAKSLATRSIAFGRRVYVPGDPKGEWTAVAQAVGGQAIELGGGNDNRLNPLDPGPRHAGQTDQEWAATVRTRRRVLLGSLAESSVGRPLRAMEHTALDAALTAACSGAEVPTLPMVVAALLEPRTGESGATIDQLSVDGREVGHALRRLVSGDLSGLFDGPSTVTFDPSLPMVSLDLSAIQGSDQLVDMVMTCASAWMEASLSDPEAGQRWVIYDEAWRMIRQPALLARMQSQWKLSRGLGIANLIVIHRLSDLDAVGDADSEARALAQGLLADCSTKIVYQQETSEAPHTADVLGLSVAERAQLPNLQVGEGLWRVGQRAFVVRHLLTEGELSLFDTNSRMLPLTPGLQQSEVNDGGNSVAGQRTAYSESRGSRTPCAT